MLEASPHFAFHYMLSQVEYENKTFALFTKFLPGNGNGALVSGSLLKVITVEWKREEDMSVI